MKFMNEIHNNKIVSDCHNIAISSSAGFHGGKSAKAFNKYLKQFQKKKSIIDMDFQEMSG